MIENGQIVLIPAAHLPDTIGHDKFAVCICNSRFLFFYFNSKPFKFTPDAQVTVYGSLELHFLDHTSYIDTSKVHQLPPVAIRTAVQNGKVWSCPQSIIDRIKQAVSQHPHLSTVQRETAMNNL